MIKTEAGEKMKEENPVDKIDTIDGQELLRQELEKEGKKFGMPETPEMNMGGLMGGGMGVIIGIEKERTVHVRKTARPSIGRFAPRPDILDQDGAQGRAIALPQFMAVDSIVGAEKEDAVYGSQLPEVRRVTGVDILDQDCARLCAVALPQLAAGAEIECVVDGGQFAGADVLHHDGAALGAVAFPQLVAIGSVGGGEKERSAYVGQFSRVPPTIGVSVNVLDHDGARFGAVALPQLTAVGAIFCGEEERAVDGGQFLRARRHVKAGIDVLDHDGAGLRAIALPQLPAVGTVFGGEKERAVYLG